MSNKTQNFKALIKLIRRKKQIKSDIIKVLNFMTICKVVIKTLYNNKQLAIQNRLNINKKLTTNKTSTSRTSKTFQLIFKDKNNSYYISNRIHRCSINNLHKCRP